MRASQGAASINKKKGEGLWKGCQCSSLEGSEFGPQYPRAEGMSLLQGQGIAQRVPGKGHKERGEEVVRWALSS